MEKKSPTNEAKFLDFVVVLEDFLGENQEIPADFPALFRQGRWLRHKTEHDQGKKPQEPKGFMVLLDFEGKKGRKTRKLHFPALRGEVYAVKAENSGKQQQSQALP